MVREWYKFFQENPSFGPILALAFIAALFFAPVHPQICPISPYQETEPCFHENLTSWLFNELDIHSGFLLALATGVIAWFTWTLKNASIKQGNQTDRALEVSERGLTIGQWPFLYIHEQRFHTPGNTNTPCAIPQFHYRYVVHGPSPALIRAAYGILVFDKEPPAIPPAKTLWQRVQGVQKEGFGVEGMIVWDGPEIISTPLDRFQARSAGKWLYAIGCIVYDDLFGNQHEFAFCYQGAIGGGWGQRAGGQKYNYHRLRNDAERAGIDGLATPTPIEAPEKLDEEPKQP